MELGNSLVSLEYIKPADADKVSLALLTSLCRAQLFGIRWEHIYWQQASLALPTIKRHRARVLPFPLEGLAILRRQLWGAGRPTSGWIFPHATKLDLPQDSGSWYKYRLKAALTQAGLTGKGLKFHSTRHAFAIRFLEREAPAAITEGGQLVEPWSGGDLYADARRRTARRHESGSVYRRTLPKTTIIKTVYFE